MEKLTKAQRAVVASQMKAANTMSNLEFLLFAKQVLAPSARPAPNRVGLSLRFPYDLRASLEMKYQDANKSARWTAFMNNAGTLCHVVSPEGEISIRVRFNYPVKHLSKQRMGELVLTRVGNYIKI